MPLPQDPLPPEGGGVDPRSAPSPGESQPSSQASSSTSGNRRKRIRFWGRRGERAQPTVAEALLQTERERLRKQLALRQAYRNAGGDPDVRDVEFRRWAASQAAAEAGFCGKDRSTSDPLEVPPPFPSRPHEGRQSWGPQQGPGWAPNSQPYPGPSAGDPHAWGPQTYWSAPPAGATHPSPGGTPPPHPAAPPPVPPGYGPSAQAAGGWPPGVPPQGYAGHGAVPPTPAIQSAHDRAGLGPPLGRPCEIELGADARGVVLRGTLEQVTNDWITVRDHFANLHWVARGQVIEIRLR